jgi:fibronectin-binding autotransporter adhesin
MTKTLRTPIALPVLIALVFTVQTAFAQTFWIGNNGTSTTTNWSDPNNWSTVVVPSANTAVAFTNTGTAAVGTVNNVVDTSTTIASLRYDETNGGGHTTLLLPGVTLRITGSSAPNTAALSAGTESAPPFDLPIMTNTITGAGAALVVSNTSANIIVRQAPNGTTGVGNRVTLDMSGLDTFNATVGRVVLSGATAGGVNRTTGRLTLAKTNTITASGTSPALIVAESNTSNNGNGSSLILGQTNVLNVNNIIVGTVKEANGLIAFNSIFNNPVAFFRAADGSRMSTWSIGDGGSNSGTTSCSGTADFSAGSVDALVDTLTVGRGSSSTSGSGLSVGTLTFSVGTLNVNTLQVGLQTASSAKTGSGTLNINSNGTLRVNTLLQLGITVGGAGTATTVGALNVRDGGKLFINSITAGPAGLANSITLTNATFVLTNTAGPDITTFAVQNSSLTLKAASGSTVTVTNLVTGGTNNTISISQIPALTNYPAQFVLIDYSGALGGAGFNFSLGTLPTLNPPFGGYISNNTVNGSVDLVLTNGPVSRGVTWQGAVSGNWDIATTLNWLTNAVATFYNDTDVLQFDDSASNSVVNVTTTVLPGNLTVTNNVLAYTWTGAGKVTGFAGLNKQGSGSLTLADAGPDSYSGGVKVAGGTLVFATDNTISGGMSISNSATVQVGTNGGSGTLPAGNIIDNGTLIFNRGGDLTVASVISGTAVGGILKSNAGILALNAANTFTGQVFVAGGTLQAGNNSALGRTNNGTVILSGATLDVNGKNLGAEQVTVSGTGVGGNGAVVNSGAAQNNALRLVTMTADTTLGGPGRWDIRESSSGANDASLTGAFKLIKVNTNQFSLVGVVADTIDDIIVQQGLFSIERGTSLGSTHSIIVSNGAGLQFFANTLSLLRPVFLTGDGVTSTVFMNSGSESINATVTLAGACIFSGNGTTLSLDNDVVGTGSVTKAGNHRLVLTGGTVNYSGSTTVSNGLLAIETSKSGGAGITILTNGFLGGGGPGHIIHENVTASQGGGFSPGTPGNTEVLTINGTVTMNSSSNVFDLNSDVNTGNDRLQISGDLHVTGTNIMRIGIVDHLTAGDSYTLVSYTGSATGLTSNSVVIVPPVFGYQFVLVDPATTAGEIRIQVTQAVGFDFWIGNDPVHPTFWDTDTTTNWERNGAAAFKSNDFACFSDFHTTVMPTNVTLVGKLTAAATIFTNGTFPFQLTGSGSLSGGGLILEGANPVLIANSGSNDWTNGVLIDGNADVFFSVASLYVGDGTTNGNLGFGTITNDGILVFNHGGGYTNALTVNNNIVNGPDSGFLPLDNPTVYGISNIGSGVVIFGGTNTFTNEFDVLNGTVVAASGTALGATNQPAIISSGATLDVSAQNLGAKHIIVGGGGVGNNGALVSISTNQQINALQYVTLTADTTFGGNARWDIRSGVATLNTLPPGSSFKVTKMGTNQISLVAVTNIESTLGDIDIQQGEFAIQTTTVQVGDPNGTITVHSNALLDVYNLTAQRVNKKIVILDGGTYTNENSSCTNIGPVTIQGTATFGIAGTSLTLASNSLSGGGTLLKVGGSTLILAGTNLYTGNTIITNGTVTLVGDSALNNSPLIDMAASGVFLDVTNRSDATLTLVSGQTLRGTGIIRGSLAVNSGATVLPGHSIGTLSVTTNVTLAGQATMELDAGASTSDQINCTNTVTYGGTLVVTNINGTLAVGQSFRLFRAGTYNPQTFASVTLPTAIPPSAYWTNNLNIDGTIKLVSSITSPPTITGVNLNGTNISMTVTNGTPGSLFYLLSSTNVATPLSNWAKLATNVFDFSGNASFSFTNGITGAQRFYILQEP